MTDVFGQRRWITPAGSGNDQDWQRWSMFTLDTIGDDAVPADTSLFLPLTVPKNTISEHWIPFIPVHVPGDNHSVQLQRAAMPSVVDGAPVRPRTSLLREGFDAGRPYFVNEEEVLRSGTRLSVAYQRTRLRDGRWLATQRGVGRGEGSSGLGFDLFVNTQE